MNNSAYEKSLASKTSLFSQNNELTERPDWDSERRELRLGKAVIKNFRWPAENQERILDAFQEENWPPRIDDPLPPTPAVCSKRRLHDTLKALNRKQAYPSIKFRGDGTGMGVLLEINGVVATDFECLSQSSRHAG